MEPTDVTGAESREVIELLPEGSVPQTVEKRQPSDEEASDYHQEICQLRSENEVVSDTDRQENQRYTEQNMTSALCPWFHMPIYHAQRLNSVVGTMTYVIDLRKSVKPNRRRRRSPLFLVGLPAT